MANMSIMYEIKKHATAYPSNVLAGEYGEHILNVKLTSDCDNGNLISTDATKWQSLDLFEETAATTFTGRIVEKMGNGNYLVLVTDPGDALLVYQVPVAAEEWTNTWKKESNMYNKTGDIVRCYVLHKFDRFELSAEGFDGTPEVGKNITGVNSKKLTVEE